MTKLSASAARRLGRAPIALLSLIVVGSLFGCAAGDVGIAAVFEVSDEKGGEPS